MLEKIDMRAAHLERIESEVREWDKQHAKSAEAELRSRAASIANEVATQAKANFYVGKIDNADAKLLQHIADALKTKLNGPVFLAGAANDRVAMLASVPKELTSKIQANKLIQEIAPLVNGKGGGRPDNAQGSGTDVGKIDNAVAAAERLIKASLA
jgi:alanyl-tRNA synthetase